VLILGVINSANSFEQAFNTVGFVKDGELGGNLRQLVHGVFAVELQNLFAVRKTCSAAVLQEQVDAIVTAKTVDDKPDACDDIDNEHDVE
jgi:hypothetical protein